MMTPEAAREYSESIGQIGAGWWRQIAWAHRQGIPEKLGLTRREWAEKYHGYLKISVADRHDAVLELAKDGMSQREIADVLGVGVGTVNRDLDVPNGTASQGEGPETVPNGTPVVAVSDAKAIAKLYKQNRAASLEQARADRIDNIAEIAKGNTALNFSQQFPVILADPPWRYEHPPMGDSNRSIENHYPTMSLEEICSLRVDQLATDDAILYLWATAPKLSECLEVVDAWGFSYRTNFVWVKDKIGMGYYARNQHELLLVANRGEIPPPAIEKRISSIIEAPRGKHSEKPDEVYQLIESFYPSLPKIELFARARHNGWQAWGNEAAPLQEASR